MEESEQQDWGVNNYDNYDQRFKKSIEAYYLDKYYDKLKDFTYKTIFYNITDTLENAIPEILPFTENFVKYSNKSPKDSEYWEPVKTKDEVVRLFYTSLRCKRHITNTLCIREWSQVPIIEEYRCFWNRRLVAVSIQRDIIDGENFNSLLEFIKQLPTPYYRAVFDIALHQDGSFKFIEYNSFETNSGGHQFNWHDDHEILFDVDGSSTIIRGMNRDLNLKDISLLKPLQITGINFNVKPLDMIILQPEEPSGWLITDKYVYIMNDKYLGRFTHDLKVINWKVGNFRFGALELIDNNIVVNNMCFHYDLTPLKNTSHNSPKCPTSQWYYGFKAILNNKLVFCRLHYSGSFEAILL